MERLTMTSDKGGVAFTFDLDINCRPSEAQKILKLAQKLYEYEQAEEQGLLLRLPTDRVWFILDAKTKYAMVMSKSINDICIYEIKELLKGKNKRYFLTKEEAEQALQQI